MDNDFTGLGVAELVALVRDMTDNPAVPAERLRAARAALRAANVAAEEEERRNRPPGGNHDIRV